MGHPDDDGVQLEPVEQVGYFFEDQPVDGQDGDLDDVGAVEAAHAADGVGFQAVLDSVVEHVARLVVGVVGSARCAESGHHIDTVKKDVEKVQGRHSYWMVNQAIPNLT